MSKYYSIKFFVESFNPTINQKVITENVVDKICDILECNYDKLGYILLHPDYEFRDLGRFYLKKNKERFYKLNIPSRLYGEKYLEDYYSAPLLIYKKKHNNNFASYSDFDFGIGYPFKDTQCLKIKIDVKKSFLKNGVIEPEQYLKIIELLNNNDFKINTSFIHYFSGSNSRDIIDGSETFLNTFEEKYIIDRAIDHIFNWKNRFIDIFLYNTFRKDCLSSEQIKELETLVGKQNIIFYKEYIIFRYCNSQSSYLLEKYFPSIKKIQLRNFFKKNNMM